MFGVGMLAVAIVLLERILPRGGHGDYGAPSYRECGLYGSTAATADRGIRLIVCGADWAWFYWRTVF